MRPQRLQGQVLLKHQHCSSTTSGCKTAPTLALSTALRLEGGLRSTRLLSFTRNARLWAPTLLKVPSLGRGHHVDKRALQVELSGTISLRARLSEPWEHLRGAFWTGPPSSRSKCSYLRRCKRRPKVVSAGSSISKTCSLPVAHGIGGNTRVVLTKGTKYVRELRRKVAEAARQKAFQAAAAARRASAFGAVRFYIGEPANSAVYIGEERERLKEARLAAARGAFLDQLPQGLLEKIRTKIQRQREDEWW
eukprot:TRINITY_DN3065_c0_g1_i3.p1 TRINITY_DN3065_c0_g1~~TRINITY_DN3065_c0_g1_i3.p1  ORF type:complete len:250 (+),score=33.00 TRINITY_DN3065_c0_g1_i3:82-831(+)